MTGAPWTPFPDVRTGNGFDVHAFGPGDGVMLCGVRVAHDRGLVGHSDADVGLHALTDAIFGALAEGDIGQWFPPSDPRPGEERGRRAVQPEAERERHQRDPLADDLVDDDVAGVEVVAARRSRSGWPR